MEAGASPVQWCTAPTCSSGSPGWWQEPAWCCLNARASELGCLCTPHVAPGSQHQESLPAAGHECIKGPLLAAAAVGGGGCVPWWGEEQAGDLPVSCSPPYDPPTHPRTNPIPLLPPSPHALHKSHPACPATRWDGTCWWEPWLQGQLPRCSPALCPHWWWNIKPQPGAGEGFLVPGTTCEVSWAGERGGGTSRDE